MRTPPLRTKSGLQIGLLHQPKRPVLMSRDELRIQEAMLRKYGKRREVHPLLAALLFWAIVGPILYLLRG
jgi:hypothetical protein